MLNKIYLPIALVLLTGCAQSSNEHSSSHWWSLFATSDQSTSTPTQPTQPQTKHSFSNWWPFTVSAKQNHAQIEKPSQSALARQQPHTQAWLDRYEAPLRTALEGSGFSLERRADVLLVSIPVQGSFNPDRPQMLMPSKLGALTRIAKLTSQDSQASAVLILGHADTSGKPELNRTLSQQRAQAVAGIFRLSGFKTDRLLLKGVGSDMPRAANDSPAGRALNRRVEVLLAPQDTLLALVQHYSKPAATILAADKTH